MADDKETGGEGGVDPSRLDMSFGGTRVTTLDNARDKDASATERTGDGGGMEFDAEGGAKRTGITLDTEADEEADLEKDLTAGDEEGDGGEEEDADKKGKEEEGDEGEPEALPEWDPANKEVSDAYDQRYFSEDGTLNTDALGKVVAANLAKEDGKPVLNDGDYGFLKDRLGLTREQVDAHIAGQVALAAEKERLFLGKVGGKEALDAKVAWASKNYTPTQKARFKAAMDEGGEAAVEQLDLLNARFTAAGQKAPSNGGDGTNRRGPPQKRPASPKKTVSSSETPAGQAGVKPFANNEEYKKALKEAQVAFDKGDKTQVPLVRKRLAASRFWR